MSEISRREAYHGNGYRVARTFEQMSEAERSEWLLGLQRRLENPGQADFVDSRTESVFEYAPVMNATVESTPDGKRYVVAYMDGKLRRRFPLHSAPVKGETGKRRRRAINPGVPASGSKIRSQRKSPE